MTFDGRTATSAAMVALFGAMVIAALGFPPEGRLLPWVVGIPGLVLTAAQLVVDAAARRRTVPAAGAEEGGAPPAARRDVAMFGWLFGFFAALLALGFLIGGPLALGAWLRFAARERWTVALLGAAAGWAVLYGAFERLLDLALFEGFLPRWLMG
jgi:hypothetical protein